MKLNTLKSIMQGHCLTVCMYKTSDERTKQKGSLLDCSSEDSERFILCKSLKYRFDGYWVYQDSLADISIDPPIQRRSPSSNWVQQPQASIDLYNLPTITCSDKILVSVISGLETVFQFYCRKINLYECSWSTDYIEGLDWGGIAEPKEILNYHLFRIKNNIGLGRIDWLNIEELNVDTNNIPIEIYAKLIRGIILKNRNHINLNRNHRYEPFEILFEPYEEEVFNKLEKDLETNFETNEIKKGEYSYRRVGKVVEFTSTTQKSSPIARSYHWYSGCDWIVRNTTITYKRVYDNAFLAKKVVDFLKKCNLTSIAYNEFLFKDATKSITTDEYEENRPGSY